MKQPCEYNSNKVLPTIRSVLTEVLIREGGLSQTQISEVLSISQAAVSHYAGRKRGDPSILASYPEISKSIRELGLKILNGMSPEERQESICSICRQLHTELMKKSLEMQR